jgi:hypothetical protein
MSGRSRVTVKKKRRAATAALMLGGHAGLRLMQLEGAQILGRCGIRRTAKERGEGLDVMDIIVARLLDEVAHRHVLDHALAQRADGLLAHRGASHPEVDNTPIVGSRRFRHTSMPVVVTAPALCAAPSRASGFVLGSRPVIGYGR